MFGKKRDKNAKPVKRRARTPKTSHLYIDKEEMMDELCAYRDTGIISDKLGDMFLKLAIRYTSKPNLSGYTYRDDMIASATSRMVEQIDKFDVDHPARNPFAYFTMLTYRQVITYIAKEHRYTGIKNSVRDKLWTEFGDEYDIQDESSSDDGFLDYVDNIPDTAEKFIEDVKTELDEIVIEHASELYEYHRNEYLKEGIGQTVADIEKEFRQQAMELEDDED